MRIRQVKPAFWSDVTTAAMVSLDDTALFYIGLWMEADDAGYLRWEPRQIAAELYPYQDIVQREAAVMRHKAELESVGRLRVFKCGHAVVPKLVDHQHFAAPDKRVFTYRREHESEPTRRSPRVPAVPRLSPQRSVKGSEGQGRLGIDAHARENGSQNGVTTIEEHDAELQPSPEEDQVRTWVTLWSAAPSSMARARAERELQKLGYREEGGQWVK